MPGENADIDSAAVGATGRTSSRGVCDAVCCAVRYCVYGHRSSWGVRESVCEVVVERKVSFSSHVGERKQTSEERADDGEAERRGAVAACRLAGAGSTGGSGRTRVTAGGVAAGVAAADGGGGRASRCAASAAVHGAGGRDAGTSGVEIGGLIGRAQLDAGMAVLVTSTWA